MSTRYILILLFAGAFLSSTSSLIALVFKLVLIGTIWTTYNLSKHKISTKKR